MALVLLSRLSAAQEARVVEKEGRVVITKLGAKAAPAVVGMGLAARDRLGTGESSRAVLQMSEKWFARVDEETDVEIMPAALNAKDQDALKVALGGAFIYSRESEGELKVQTPTATGGLRGTQLMVRVLPDGKTLMQVLEGEVDLGNDLGNVLLKAGEAGEAEPGKAPRKTAVIEAHNLLQWALYYPAVILPDETGLDDAERHALADSLTAYRQGDLLGALGLFPAGYAPTSESAKIYRAAVLLATGRVNAARKAMAGVPTEHPGRRAIERMLAAVLNTGQSGTATTASEVLAESYYQQSRRDLEAALAAAKRASEMAPSSGFAWTRLAELEFSFGRSREALAALERGLKLTPLNAQAHALRGFLLSAENRIAEAQASFQEAVRLDGGLGNAWLGLGLTKIKQGRLEEGRGDLQTAVTVEPTRSSFYSYHGKALSLAGQVSLAQKDLDLARQLDPKDPTPWLYSAIQNQQEGRYNESIGDMQESIRLNDNRSVFRSQFLLDQDGAVRSSNLAKIYQNNGMTEVAVREATRAVETDYTNASAHLFLANSFDALRDPNRVQLRHETAWFNEQLLAYLLAPVGGGPLSQFVSQQEYSKLLEADGVGGSFVTEWRDRGYFDQQASVFATFGKVSSGLDFAYHNDDGNRPNNSSTRKELYWQLKFQVSASDMFYTLAKWGENKSGDLAQNYANVTGNAGLRFKEDQSPGLFLVGWNHQWAPGINTLFIGGRLASEQNLSAPNTTQLLLQRDPAFLQPGFLRPKTGGGLEYTSDVLRNATVPSAALNSSGTLSLSADFQRLIAPLLGGGAVTGVFLDRFDFSTHRQFEILSGELQHIWQTSHNTLLLGGRWQEGEFETRDRLDLLNASIANFFTSPAAQQNVTVDFKRQSLYAYDFLSVAPSLTLIGGVSYDRLDHPDNFRNPPVNDRQVHTERVNTKLGFTFTPSSAVTIRGVYTEALGGVSFDESVRLEPVQLAGFNQAFRTAISESLVGSVEALVYKNWGISAEGRLPSRTWWGGSFNRLTEDVKRTVGVFDIVPASLFPSGAVILPSSTGERMAYSEDVFSVTINQLIGSTFAVGAGYRHTAAELYYRSTQIPVALAPSSDRRDRAVLDELTLNANWNSSDGWFARAEADWLTQDLSAWASGAAVASPPGDSFWQFSALGGRRFHHNMREVSAGVYNLTDQDYRLSPLDYTRELPRARTVFVKCRVNF